MPTISTFNSPWAGHRARRSRKHWVRRSRSTGNLCPITPEKSTMIPQTSPKASYLAHQPAIDAGIRRVLESGWYLIGQEIAQFEEEFAAYIGCTHAIGVANGTDAIE